MRSSMFPDLANDLSDMFFINHMLNAAQRTDSRSLLVCLMQFKLNHPNRCAELDDPNSPVGASCVSALSIAVKANDQRSMIVLLTKRRAKQVFKNPILKSPVHAKGLNFLKNALALHNAPTGFAKHLQTLHATPYPKNGKQWELDEPINAVLQTAKELLVSYTQKQTIVRAVESNMTPASSVAKRKM